MAKPRLCFFARIDDEALFESHAFYKQDIEICRSLGFEVVTSSRPGWLPHANVYLAWWWTWAFVPLFWARLRQRPIVITGVFDHVNDEGDLEDYPNRPAHQRVLMRLALSRATVNVFLSAREADACNQRFRVARSIVCPLGVNTELYRHGQERRRPMDLLTVCWLKKENVLRKCLPELLLALAQVARDFPEIRLTICGAKSDGYPILAELVNRLNLQTHVRFVGRVDESTKIAYMQRTCLYVQPTRAEGFGLAIAEAMACGAPVITSERGTVPEVGGDCVAFVDGSNPDAIARQIVTLLTDAERRERLGRCGRSRVIREFSVGARKRAMADLFQDLGVLPSTPPQPGEKA